jgi:ATP-binding cassette subfamily C protein
LPLQLVLTAARTRFEAAAAFDLQRGIWGRVLRSPLSLVKRIGAGDVAIRFGALESARDPIDETVLAPIPGLLSSLLAGAVLFYFNAQLAMIVIAVGLAVLFAAILLARTAAREQEALDAGTGSVNGFLFQVLLAIPKLRVAAAESRAFLAWAGHFRNAVGQRLMRAVAHQRLLVDLIPTVGALALYAGVASIGPQNIGIGLFMAFQTTYLLFLSGVALAAAAAGTVLQLRPVLRRATELTQAPLESGSGRADPGRLKGGLSLTQVTFRYDATARPVLDNLSLQVEPGEMVAIAGHSGSGKSTLLRILLGFEEPEQGSVLFDDQQLVSLDVEAVRRQLGVVMQDGQLIPGSVHENIAGVATLSEQQAWELAEIVALADDIRAMPMGMLTMVTLNGGAFSGGQRQRLLIARALAARPQILLLDEATSALDNITQRVITKNLAELGMTRIVIAHRLSTLVHADRIIVLEHGRIAEEGDFDTLMARNGTFRSMATRQLLER